MPQILCHRIAIAGGSGGGIGGASSGQNDPVGENLFLVGLHTDRSTVFYQNRLDLSRLNRDFLSSKLVFQAVQNRLGLVRHWKYPVAPLRFQRAAILFKE